MVDNISNILPISVVGVVSGTLASGTPTSIFSTAAIQRVVIVNEDPIAMNLVSGTVGGGDGGSSTFSVREVGTSSNIQTDDDVIAATASGITLTLPVASTAGEGKQIIVKDKNGNAGTGDITVASGTAGDDIDGGPTFVLDQNFMSVSVISDGTSRWMVV